jgi:hypothetical protein
MNDQNVAAPVNILLSREELLFVLNLLQAEFMPGLDPDPLGDLTAEQQALALTVAGRALQARELARLHPTGEWVVHNNLLMAVGACAYAQGTISIYHWPPGGAWPSRFFACVRENDVVAHTRPADVLHQFSLLSSKDELIAQALAVCAYQDGPVSQPQELTVSTADFVKVRELTGAGDAAGAVDLLVANGVSSETAQAFVATLAGSPRVSILQALKQPANAPVQKQDFTVLQNGQHSWLIMAPPGATDDSLLSVKTTTRDEVQVLLSEWL